jgi:hypothetical protein
MNRTEAWNVVGGLSNPSKMPGYAIGLPAAECITGSILRTVAGSVCASCYARKGNYCFPRVTRAQYRRFHIARNVLNHGRGSNAWRDYVEAFRVLLRGENWFRVHDSGDMISADHFRLYFDIARACPSVRFWIPTKELSMLRSAAADIPPNVTVRVSAAMRNKLTLAWHNTSAVFDDTTAAPADSHICRAYTRDGHCGRCRACWNGNVATIVYPKH